MLDAIARTPGAKPICYRTTENLLYTCVSPVATSALGALFRESDDCILDMLQLQLSSKAYFFRLGRFCSSWSVKVHIVYMYSTRQSPAQVRPETLHHSEAWENPVPLPQEICNVICMCCASRDSMTPPVASTLVRPASSGIGRDDTSSHPGVIVASTHSRRYSLCSFRDRFICCLLQTSRRVSVARFSPPSTAAFSNSWLARYLHQHSPLLLRRASERATSMLVNSTLQHLGTCTDVAGTIKGSRSTTSTVRSKSVCASARWLPTVISHCTHLKLAPF